MDIYFASGCLLANLNGLILTQYCITPPIVTDTRTEDTTQSKMCHTTTTSPFLTLAERWPDSSVIPIVVYRNHVLSIDTGTKKDLTHCNINYWE